jgi:hypothetical protein
MIMQSLKLVLDVGLQFIPGVGKILDAGLGMRFPRLNLCYQTLLTLSTDMATTAAQMASYIYPEEEDPEGAFNWWLSPCGSTKLVPDEIKEVFGILSQVADGISSFKEPKKLKKGQGKKGDDANPHDQSNPRSTNNNNNSGGGSGKKKCKIQGVTTTRKGPQSNTLRMMSCNKKDETETSEMIITSLAYGAGGKALQVKAHCSQAYSQACFHYSSAIRVNPQWATLKCPDAAATTSKIRRNDVANGAPATRIWTNQRKGKDWMNPAKRQGPKKNCQRDEYPPAYLLTKNDVAWTQGGIDSTGQLIRYLPGDENIGAAHMWGSVCMSAPLGALSDKDFYDKVKSAANNRPVNRPTGATVYATVTVPYHPEFTIDSWGHSGAPPANDGLDVNDCWPKEIARQDPGFPLLLCDPYYGGKAPPYDYSKPYKQGTNGS